MKLLSAWLVLLAVGNSHGFQVKPRLSGRPVKSAQHPNHHHHDHHHHQKSSSLVVCQMLMHNDALNLNTSSYSQQQSHSQHYFQNQKVNGEVAKPSYDEGSSYPEGARNQHCTGLRMAHGAICPETIAVFEKDPNPAIRRFVETYHKFGPMACEDLLSDPEVLPHLTKAMRDLHL